MNYFSSRIIDLDGQFEALKGTIDIRTTDIAEEGRKACEAGARDW